MNQLMMLRACSCILLGLAAGCAGLEPTDTEGDGGVATLAVVQAEAPALQLRFQGAERVVLGTVERVSAAFGHNQYGDYLILSTVTVRVVESLRGAAAVVTRFELEGGTVGDLTLEVSDLPSLSPGDHGVFALQRSAIGGWVPNRRGLGILLLPAGADLTLVRRAEEVSR